MPITNPKLFAVVPRTRQTGAPKKRSIADIRSEASVETRTKETIDRTQALFARLEAREAALKAQIAALAKSKAIVCARIARLEDETLQRMDKLNLKIIDGFKVRFTAKPCPVSVDVFNESKLPKEYLREKTVSAPDKHAIRQALDAEIEVPGAKLVQNVSLSRK